MTAPEIGIITEQNDLGMGFDVLKQSEAEFVAPKKERKSKKKTADPTVENSTEE